MSRFALISLALLLVGAVPAHGEDLPRELENVDVTERLGGHVPLDATFTDEAGETVQLRDYIRGDVPVLLTMNYYGCPMLCGLQLNALLDALGELDWAPGENFRIVTISINPEEGPGLARAKREAYLEELGRGEVDWTFLTGDEVEIQRVADAVGFGFEYVEAQDEYAHPAVLTFVSPQGVVTRYLYGLLYEVRDVRLALLEAADGKIGSTIDRLILSCFVYDPDANSYVQDAMFVMRAGGALTVLLLGGFVAALWRRERTPAPELV